MEILKYFSTCIFNHELFKLKYTASIKPLLDKQLKQTHTEQNWFVPINTVLFGITERQANWKDGSENHSIAELVSHVSFF